MKLVAAYLLASLAGNPSPNKDDVRKILDSVGAEVEEDKMEMLFKEVEGKDVVELLAAGREKFAYAPTGGSAGKTADISVHVVRTTRLLVSYLCFLSNSLENMKV
ncbi:hypothetical protein ACQ4PT_051154 [Festuca glaucescens]